MARATVTKTRKEVVKVEEVKTGVTLQLTALEAVALRVLLGAANTKPFSHPTVTSLRGVRNSLEDCLNRGVEDFTKLRNVPSQSEVIFTKEMTEEEAQTWLR